MTRKDYLTLEAALRNARIDIETDFGADSQEAGIDGWERVVYRIAELLEDNSHFDRDHFLAVVRGEKELTSRPPRKRTTEEWAERLANRMNNQTGDCQ